MSFQSEPLSASAKSPSLGGRSVGVLVKGLELLVTGLFYLNSFVGCALLLVMLAVAAAGVLARFVLHSSLAWAEEANTYFFVWLTCLGAAVALDLGLHPGLNSLTSYLPKWLQQMSFVLSHVATLVLGALFFYYGIGLINLLGEETGSAILLPMSYWYAAIPYVGLCFILISLRSLLGGESHRAIGVPEP
jgi:TRAP-type C4-dicarboxylate transport system permease small subunit